MNFSTLNEQELNDINGGGFITALGGLAGSATLVGVGMAMVVGGLVTVAGAVVFGACWTVGTTAAAFSTATAI